MSKATPPIAALNAGEWTPDLDGRVDLQGYAASAQTLDNFIPLVQGPIVRRPGTKFVAECSGASGDQTWLIPFTRSRDTAYIVELGDLVARFYTNQGAILTGSPFTITNVTQADPAVVTFSAVHSFANGDRIYIDSVAGMSELNGRWFVTQNGTPTTVELTNFFGDNIDSTGYTAYSAGGTADEQYTIVSPYAASSLVGANGEFMLDYAQSGDVMYITDRAGVVGMQTLTRTSSTNFAFANFRPDDGPFEDFDTSGASLYVSAATGSVTITASASVFSITDINRLVRIEQEDVNTAPWLASTGYTANDIRRSAGHEYTATNTATSGTTPPTHTDGIVTDGGVTWRYDSSGYGIARITAFSSATSVTATVLTRFPNALVGSGTPSTLWRFGTQTASSHHTNCTFFKGRLVMARGERVDMSKTDNYDSFGIDTKGEILKTDAISVYSSSEYADDIVGLSAGQNTLSVYTEGAEHIIKPLTASEAFGPGNLSIDPAGTFGSDPVIPVRMGEVDLFVQAGGKRVREQAFDIGVDGFVTRDMMLRANHLTFGTRIIQMARQTEPFQLLWVLLANGTLLSLTYDRTQEVRGWSRHTIGGSGIVESICVIPSPSGDQDDLWAVVKRTIGGTTRRYIEYVSPPYITGDDEEGQVFTDSSVTQNSGAQTTHHGWDHLEGESVVILGDGVRRGDLTVTNGDLNMGYAITESHAGLQTTCQLVTSRLEAAAADGTAQGKTKRITDATFRVKNTKGGQVGPSLTNLSDLPDLTYTTHTSLPAATPETLVSDDVHIDWPGGYETDGRICYKNDSPFNVQISMIMPQVVTEESR